MVSDTRRTFVSRRPGLIVGLWLALAVVIGLASPNLTRLAAEGQARVLGEDVESRRAAAEIAKAWPDEAYESLAVLALYRPEGLTPKDREYASRLARALEGPGKPSELLRVIGPNSGAEVAKRLVSRDGTMMMVALPMSKAFVSPSTQEAIARLRAMPVQPDLAPPPGLQILWTGDAVIGRDYMRNVDLSLHRAAAATVVLLLLVLLAVYRSFLLAMVPLVTIGVSLVIARGILAWMAQAGWEISSLVELFLVAVLFGSGTDFCLFISWRYAESWDVSNPAKAMDTTLSRSVLALLTSAGTVIVGFSLMGTNKFRLFSSTGPSVAIGLALTLAATLTLTPALLVLLARHHPRAFRGMTAPSSGFWERVGQRALARPVLSWIGAVVVMAPLAFVGMRTKVVQDLLTEMPPATPSASAFKLIASKFDPGVLAPLSVVLKSKADLHSSEGLALIDDLSRYLSHFHHIDEVRSATQPLGSPDLLNQARISARLSAIRQGFGQLDEGAGELEKGLSEAAVKLRAALWLESKTGLSILGPPPAGSTKEKSGTRKTAVGKEDARTRQVGALLKAAEGAGRIAEGLGRAKRELETVLDDPVGRRALDHLLVNRATITDHPELARSFATYITPDGHYARLDVAQGEQVFSAGAMNGVDLLNRKIKEFLADADGPEATALIAGSDAESADVRKMTHADQLHSWFVIPAGVFFVLLISLRDLLGCMNLVATMLLTYAFALGATDLVFVTGLGAEGLDWKVPYFLFVVLVAVGVDYNVFLMARLHEEASLWGLRPGIIRAVGQTGGLITSAAAITACSFASFLTSPLVSLRQLGFALVVGITIDALLVRPILVPCGHWLLYRQRDQPHPSPAVESDPAEPAAAPQSSHSHADQPSELAAATD